MKISSVTLWLFCLIGFSSCQKNPQSPTGAMVESNQNSASTATNTAADSNRGVLGGAPTNTQTTIDNGVDNSGGSKSSNSSSGGSNH